MLAYMEGGTWSSLPPQPWGHGHLLFYETNATHAFSHLVIRKKMAVDGSEVGQKKMAVRQIDGGRCFEKNQSHET